MSFCIHPWKYINEGNVHIVLQILNSDYVLRLIKEDCKTKKFNISESVEFVNSVMIPLIFSDKKYQEEIVEISSEEIVELTKSLHKFRPKNRIYKSIMTTAIKAPNLTMVTSNADNFCIEIKPKEGFLANSLKRYSKCYYCMKQFLKLSENHIQHISNYCPLDLFSGDTDRMKFALKSLIDNPQNNFKFFKNANVIYKENISNNNFETVLNEVDMFGKSVNLFLDFVIEILLSDGKSDITVLPTVETNSISKSQHCRDGNNLKNNTFLYKLLDLQRLSENFIYTPNMCDEVDYVKEILKRIETQNLDLLNADHRKIFLTWDPLYLALISAIVKDCSIMLSFTTNINNEYPKVTVGGRKMSYKLGVTDLEPKPAKVLHKRCETEKKLLDIYAKIDLTSK
ncbi:inositol-pentakisphosphate 2-kinase isoform X1 [Papilio machaon]|uniref:inositol-pentakisphosphate 2-kinase isoform X1 n=1 Tax=Papilio machaon TaxID=76193 RepID=UPI001E662D13|nr:inositol-pentakisphosphate 2-kinase isoform X1 [Papilio machaon]